jgi:ribonuclease P protein component
MEIKNKFSDQKFRREERLKSQKIIGELFKTGKSVAAYPLRLVWLDNPSFPPSHTGGGAVAPVQVTVSVSKKKFKRAVDRNLLRRRTKEAFRLQKENIYIKLTDNQSFAWLIIFTAKEILDYKEIERGMKKLIRRFQEQIENKK